MPNKVAQDSDIKDREGTQPKKYHSGLSKSTKAKRDAHFKKGAEMDDNNPAAYKPAPGDADAKTKESKYTKKFKQMYGEEKMKDEIFEDTSKALKNKAEKSGVSVGILRKVYNRGVAAWRTGHRPGTTPEQWGMARVNSFLTGGKTRTTADADLWKKVRKEEYDATPGGHEWGTDKSVKLAKKKTPGEKEMKSMDEWIGEAVDPSDTGGAEEVSMAKKQIAAMRHYLDGIESSVKAKGDMEEWYQNKLTKANDYLKTLYGYAKGDVAEEVDLDEATYKVDVEGLPVFYMDAASPEKVKTALRKLLRKASAIQDVDRVTSTTVRADYRDRIKNPNPDGDSSDD